MKKYLSKLKTILQSRHLYFILILFTLIYVIYKNINPPFKYNGSEQTIIGIINSIKIDGNKLKLELIAQEKIIVTYYVKDDKELVDIKARYQLGDKLVVNGTFIIPNKNTVFNLFNYRNYLKSKKIYRLYNATSITKINNNISFHYRIKNMIISRINKLSSSNYLNAFILGDTSLIDNNIKNSYQINGVSHLFAISGMHVTLFSTLILYFLKKISKNDILNKILLTLFLLIYAFMANFTPSIMRTVLFFILVSINEIFNFKIKTINLLILTCICLLFYNPFYIYSIGFVFSFIITFYLIIFSELINNHRNYYVKLLVTSIISFLASLPIVINNFFSINLLSIIFNLVFVPLVSYLVFPLTLITFIFPLFNHILIFFLNILENMSLFCSKIDFLNITLCKLNIYLIIGYYILITVILCLFKKGKYQSILILVPVLFIHNNILIFNKYPIITMLDVGQGDSILISLPHNKGNILIDTGGVVNYNKKGLLEISEYSIALNKTIPYLKSLGIKKLDYLILSHGDYDHAGEAQKLISNYYVSNLILNSGNDNSLEQEILLVAKKYNINIKHFSQNMLSISNYKFYFLNDSDLNSENEDSLIILVKINNHNILFMSDVGIDSEKYILSKYNLPKIDILKVGHHGSKTSSGKHFIDYINPKYSIISVGKNNRYGHPNNDILENLEMSKIYRTDTDGSVRFKIKGNKLEIETCPS